MQFGVNHFEAAESGARLDVNRDATTLVSNEDRPGLLQSDGDAASIPSKRLINTVVEDFP